jgi:hypothetical protein
MAYSQISTLIDEVTWKYMQSYMNRVDREIEYEKAMQALQQLKYKDWLVENSKKKTSKCTWCATINDGDGEGHCVNCGGPK